MESLLDCQDSLSPEHCSPSLLLCPPPSPSEREKKKKAHPFSSKQSDVAFAVENPSSISPNSGWSIILLFVPAASLT